MSQPGSPAGRTGSVTRPDAESRRVLSRLGLLLTLFAVIAALCLATGVATKTAASAFGGYCAIASLVRLRAAIRWRERLGAASLNCWDEGLALAAASLLAYAVARLLTATPP